MGALLLLMSVKVLAATDLVRLGRERFAKGDFATAVAAYEKVDNKDRRFLRSRGELAWAYLRLGDRGAALGMTQQLLQNGGVEEQQEALIVRAIIQLKACAYQDVQSTIAEFQERMRPWAKTIQDNLLATGGARLPWYDAAWERARGSEKQRQWRRFWQNRERTLSEAIRRLQFVRVELLAQTQMEQAEGRVVRDVANAEKVATLSDQTTEALLRRRPSDVLIFPRDREVWSDEEFKTRGLYSANCARALKR